MLSLQRHTAAALKGSAAVLLALSLVSGAALAGAITNIAPLTSNTSTQIDLGIDQTGPSIEVPPLLSEGGLADLGANLRPSRDAAQTNLQQQPYVPWIVQDRESLDWFGKRDDLLSVDAGAPRSTPADSITVLNQPYVPYTGENQDYVPTYTPPRNRSANDGDLDTTLTKLIAGFFQSLGYVKTIVVLGPAFVVAVIIGMVQLAKILRVSQGLDPEHGRRWGIKRSGQFGRIDETNDNSARRRDVA